MDLVNYDKHQLVIVVNTVEVIFERMLFVRGPRSTSGYVRSSGRNISSVQHA